MWQKIKEHWWAMTMWLAWKFAQKCPKCGYEMERWSAGRYDCRNCGHKIYTGW